MKQIIIQLVSQQDYCHGAIVQGTDIETFNELPLAQLHDKVKGTKCTVLVPGDAVRLTHVNIPKTSHHKLVKAVPYALEDTSIDDIDDLHFALGNYNADGELSVAVAGRTSMQHWIAQLHDQQVFSSNMLPEQLALPWQENHWHLLLSQDKAWLRLNHDNGFCVPREQLTPLLQLLINEEQAPPTIIDINYTEAAAAPDAQFLLAFGIPLNTAEQPIDPLALFVQGLHQHSTLNLLQADYQIDKTRMQSNKLWHWCGYLGLALCAVWVATQVAQIMVLSHHEKQLTAQIDKLYYQVFPDAQSVISPRLRIERIIKSGSGSTTGGKFLSTLVIIGKQLKQSNNAVQISSINFDNTAMRLAVTTRNFTNLNRFTAALKAKGLKVTQSNARTEDDEVSAQLSIGS